MKIFAFLFAVLAITLVGCTSGGDCGRQTTLTAVDAYDVPRAAAAANACGCAAAPLEAEPLIYGVAGEYGYVLGQPGVREHAKAAITLPANVLACLTEGAAEGLVLIGKTARCVVNGFFPEPAPSKQLVRLNRISRADADALKAKRGACAPAAAPLPLAVPASPKKVCPEPIAPPEPVALAGPCPDDVPTTVSGSATDECGEDGRACAVPGRVAQK